MSLQAERLGLRRGKPGTRWIMIGVATLALVVAMALDTKVVIIGSAEDVQPGVFSPEKFGAELFPKVKGGIEARAVDAQTLAAAIVADKDAATKQYGVPTGTGGAEFSVKFTGVAGDAKSGVYAMTVQGIPETISIQLQTGPAIMGTDLRDATGEIKFGQFVNQIEYQNAGSALNKEMKKQILTSIDTANLKGKTIAVIGAFKPINPKKWLVTPVRLEIQP
jgi:predicted lipoprotein